MVWIVDDEPVVTASLKALVTLESSFTVTTFNCPKTALDYLHTLAVSQLPDVIISDYNMPKLTGIEFLKAVKQQHPNLTLILLTGYADKQNAIESINEAGVFRYLEKPWNNDTLLHTLHQAYERTHLIARLDEQNAALAQLNQTLEQQVKQRTRALEATNAELEALIQHSADGIVGLDENGNITVANTVFLNWVAHSTKQPTLTTTGLIGSAIDNWLPSLTLVQPAHTPNSTYLELTLGNMTIEASYAPVTRQPLAVTELPTLEETQLPHSIWILRDVTQRKAVERLRDDFMATLTHDLRTPLHAAIQGINFLVQEQLGAITPAQRELLTVFHHSHEEMLRLVNTLLDCYRYEAGQQRLVFEATAIESLVEQVCQALAPLAGSRNQTLQYQALDEAETLCLPPTYADKHEIKRVIKNLVGNAIAHTPKGGSLQVGFTQWTTLPIDPITTVGCSSLPEAALDNLMDWKNQPWLGVWVKDNGRGITLEDQKLLFHRFSQGSSQKRNSGSGLGLYLSAQIMQAHEGLVWVESTAGEGACFYLALPVKPC
jgi:NtrC-family two-component system sensor histidine kinase KinB